MLLKFLAMHFIIYNIFVCFPSLYFIQILNPIYLWQFGETPITVEKCAYLKVYISLCKVVGVWKRISLWAIQNCSLQKWFCHTILSTISKWYIMNFCPKQINKPQVSSLLYFHFSLGNIILFPHFVVWALISLCEVWRYDFNVFI